MTIHTEINFETEICEHLAANGWMYADKDAAGFVRGVVPVPGRRTGMDPDDSAGRLGRSDKEPWSGRGGYVAEQVAAFNQSAGHAARPAAWL